MRQLGPSTKHRASRFSLACSATTQNAMKLLQSRQPMGQNSNTSSYSTFDRLIEVDISINMYKMRCSQHQESHQTPHHPTHNSSNLRVSFPSFSYFLVSLFLIWVLFVEQLSAQHILSSAGRSRSILCTIKATRQDNYSVPTIFQPLPKNTFIQPTCLSQATELCL
jgi:hypothetical protein